MQVLISLFQIILMFIHRLSRQQVEHSCSHRLSRQQVEHSCIFQIVTHIAIIERNGLSKSMYVPKNLESVFIEIIHSKRKNIVIGTKYVFR